MSSVALVLPLASNIQKHDFYIGVDLGALLLIDKGIPVDIAVGDFDSCDDEQFNIIKSNAKSIIKHDSVKDDTDTALGLSLVDYSKYDEVYVYGSFQKRFDHALANYNLLIKSNHRILMVDEFNYVYKLVKGVNRIKKNDYHYISFFAFNKTNITLKGFKYKLLNYELNPLDNLAISNELITDEGMVEIDRDVICILSKDK